MKILRELTPYEQFLQTPNKNNRFNICYAVEYSAPTFSKDQFKYALVELQKNKPLVRSYVSQNSENHFFFSEHEKPIPYEEIYVPWNRTWIEIVSNEIHTPFNHFHGPLVRIKHIIGHSLELNYILISFDHLIADGISGAQFAVDLLDLLGNPSDSKSLTHRSCNKNLMRHPRRKTGLLYAKLDRARTLALLQKAKEKSCSIQSILLSAELLSLKENIKLHGTEIEHETAINLRRYSPNFELRSLFGVIRGAYPIDNHSDFWTLSKDITGFINRKLNTNLLKNTFASAKLFMSKYYCSALSTSKIKIAPPLDDILRMKDEINTTRCAVSNLGVIQSSLNATKVKSFYVFLAVHGRFHSGNYFHLMGSTFNKELSLTFSYPISKIAVHEAEKIFNQIMDWLQ